MAWALTETKARSLLGCRRSILREALVHEVSRRQPVRGNLRGKRVDGTEGGGEYAALPCDQQQQSSAKDRELGYQLAKAALRHAAAMWSVSVIQTAAPSDRTCCRARRNGRNRNG